MCSEYRKFTGEYGRNSMTPVYLLGLLHILK